MLDLPDEARQDPVFVRTGRRADRARRLPHPAAVDGRARRRLRLLAAGHDRRAVAAAARRLGAYAAERQDADPTRCWRCTAG